MTENSKQKIYVRRLDPSSGDVIVERTTEVMVEAFKGDLFTEMLVCGQLDLYHDCQSAQIRAGLFAGEVWVAGFTPEEILATAVWFGPGQELLGGLNWEAQMELGWKEFQGKLDSDGKRDWWMSFLGQYCKMTTQALFTFGSKSWKFDSWHLQLIGVDPKHRNKGLGRALIEIIQSKAKEQNLGLSVETETPESVSPVIQDI